MCVGVRSLAMGGSAIVVGGLEGENFTCSNYSMWHKAFPHRVSFQIPYVFLDTSRNNICNRHPFETVPIGYVWYGMI